jgi:hypothetical protein
MSRRAAQLAVALLASLASGGCFSLSGRFGAPIPLERVNEIRAGETTREQITAWFGPPSAFFKPGLLDLILADGSDVEAASAPVLEDVYSYRYIETRVRLAIVPLILLRARATTQTESLIVFFDESGVVRYHGFRHDGPGHEIGGATDE